MTQLECLLCLELNEVMEDCIRINSSNEQNIKSLIEKHISPMESLKSKSSWLCVVCWEMLEDFHRFFKRIKDAHLYYECFAHCENESEYEEILIDIQAETSEDDEVCTDLTYEGLKYRIEEINIEKNYLENQRIEEPTIEKHTTEDDIEHLEIQDDVVEEVETEDYEINDYLSEDSNEPELVLKENVNNNEEIHTKKTEVNAPVSNKPRKIVRERERPYNKEIGFEHDILLAKHYEISCDLCKVPFKTFPQLMKHFVEKHTGTKPHTICCGNKYFSRASLVDHIQMHLDPDYFKCKRCPKILKSRSGLVNHIAWHDGKLYRCKICYMTYRNKLKFDKHQLIHDSSDQPPLRFPCAECDKTFRHKSGLTQHHLRVHQNRLLKLCTICGASFRDHDSFKRHMAKHEGKPSPTSYPCDICGLILSRKQCVKIHKELKHPEADKPPLTCNVCHKYQTTSQCKLRDHIRLSHKTERKHKCHICEKTFKERKKLKDHIGMHTGEPVYTCAWCPKTFYSSGNLSSHRIRFHAKEWEETKRKKYEAKEHSIDKQSLNT